MTDIGEAIERAAFEGARRALEAHELRLAFTYEEAGRVLACSQSAVSRMVRAGLLELVPFADHRITLGSLRRVAGVDGDPAPAGVVALVRDDVGREAS